MIPQPPPGYIPAGHHGGAKNAQGQWWYPSKAHAYAHAAAVDNAALLHNPNRGGDAVTYQQMQAESEALYAHGHAMPNESHAERHALYDAHVNGPLTAATQRFATATANAAAAAAGVEAAHEHADSELEDAGRYLQEQQDTANELAPYEDMEMDTHNEWGIASQEPDHHLGADHPEVHAARAFHAAAVSHAEPQEDDDPDHAEALAAYHAHVHGPLAEATKRYAEARAKHAAAMSQASAQAAAARAEWVDAAAYLAAQQAVAGNLVSGWPESATGGEDLTEDVADGRKQDHEDPDTDEVDAAQRFLTRAKTLQATAHAATHAQGINMDEAERRDEDDGEEIPMSKSMRAFRAEWAAFQDLFKGRHRYTTDPRTAQGPGWEPVEKPRGGKPSWRRVSNPHGAAYQKLQREHAYHRKQEKKLHQYGRDLVDFRVMPQRGESFTMASSAAFAKANHHRGRAEQLAAEMADHPGRPGAPVEAPTPSPKEPSAPARSVRHASQGTHRPEVGTLSPAAQVAHRLLQDLPAGSHVEDAIRQRVAQHLNEAITREDFDGILQELGGHVQRHTTGKRGVAKVKLRKAGTSVDLDLFRAEVEAFRALMGV